MTYQAKFNSQARQWDVVDENNQIVAMFGGGMRGKRQAEQSAAKMTAQETSNEHVSEPFRSIINSFASIPAILAK